MYGVVHMDGSGEDNLPIESFSALYDELFSSGIKDGDVSVIDDDTGWGISAYRDGRVVFGQIGENSTPQHMKPVSKHKVIQLWILLAQGDINALISEPWKSGYI